MLPPELIAKLNECSSTNFVNNRGSWLFWQTLYAKMVIGGLLFEGPELVHETLSLFGKWYPRIRDKFPRFNRFTSSKRLVDCTKVAAFIGWIFIVWGLAGELRATSRIVDLSANIEECSNAKVGQATLEADDAKTSADDARKDAEEIRGELNQSRADLEASQKRLDKQQQKTVRAQRKAADAQRKVLEMQRNIIRAMGQAFRPRRVISLNWNDEEKATHLAKFKKLGSCVAVPAMIVYQQGERTLASDIEKLLDNDGWTNVPVMSADEAKLPPGAISEGVQIATFDKNLNVRAVAPKPPKTVEALMEYLKLDLGPPIGPTSGVRWEREGLDRGRRKGELTESGFHIPENGFVVIVGHMPLMGIFRDISEFPSPEAK